MCMRMGPSYALSLQPGAWSFELESRFDCEERSPESSDILRLTLRTADAQGTVWEFQYVIDAVELLWKAYCEGPRNARAWWHRAKPEWRDAFEKTALMKGVHVFTDAREERKVEIGDDVVILYTKYFGAVFHCAVLTGRSAAEFCLLVGVTHMQDPDMIAVPPHITCLPLFSLLAYLPPFMINDETSGDFVHGNCYEVNRTSRMAEPQPVEVTQLAGGSVRTGVCESVGTENE